MNKSMEKGTSSFFDVLSEIDLIDKSILDVGCGDGRILQHLKNYKAGLYVGLDYDHKKLKKAKMFGSVLVGDGSNLPFQDSSFDLIIEFHVLHHMKNYKTGINDADRCLKDQGYFLIVDAVEDNPFFRLGRSLHPKIEDMPILSRYYYKDLKSALENQGFSILKEYRFALFFDFLAYIPLPSILKRFISQLDSVLLEKIIPQRYCASCVILAQKTKRD